MSEPANVFLSGVVGSTAYGLAGPSSDIDRLGVYAAPTIAFHGLHPPTGRDATTVTTKPDVTFHEAGKYAALCLNVNPTVTELLWLPEDLYETRTALGDHLIGIRAAFLSAHRVRDAYLGYAVSQFKRLETRGDGSFSADTRKRTAKHARHLARLVHQGLQLYRSGELDVRLANPDWYRGFGERVAGGDLDEARRVLAEAEADFAGVRTPLPDEPDRARVEEWLHEVRAAHLPNRDGPCPHAAEAARLRESEDATPLDPACEPTPAQWLHKFNSATPQQRLVWAQDILRFAGDSARCRFLLRHDDQISDLRGRVEELQHRAEMCNQLHPAPGDAGLFLVDLDGTVALRQDTDDTRSPYDWDRVGEDIPHTPVVTVVRALAAAGHRVIYLSGRSDECRAATGVWIAAHIGVPGESLLMRPAGDRRPDYQVKRALYERFVEPVGPVTAVLDDRASVVRMWREDLGLTVLQVDEGNF